MVSWLLTNYLSTVSLCFTEMNSRYSKQCNGILVVNYLLTVSLCFTEMNSRYSKQCNGILVVNYLLNSVALFSPRWTRDILNTVMVSWLNTVTGILVVNYLFNSVMVVSLCFTEMNSRYSKHCNGILVVNYLLTGIKCRFVSPRWTRDILNTVMVSWLLTIY